jgi:hypothetical protein
MIRLLRICLSLAFVTTAIPLRAANRPHAGTESQNAHVWTNEDLDKLHDLGLISVVGRLDEETANSPSLSKPYVKTQDPQWYAERAAKLRAELERRRTQLSAYRQAIEDAKSLKKMPGGINLDEGDIGITPEAGIEILQQHVSETQMELDALEDLARRKDIQPGALRGQ